MQRRHHRLTIQTVVDSYLIILFLFSSGLSLPRIVVLFGAPVWTVCPVRLLIGRTRSDFHRRARDLYRIRNSSARVGHRCVYSPDDIQLPFQVYIYIYIVVVIVAHVHILSGDINVWTCWRKYIYILTSYDWRWFRIDFARTTSSKKNETNAYALFYNSCIDLLHDITTHYVIYPSVDSNSLLFAYTTIVMLEFICDFIDFNSKSDWKRSPKL